MKRVWSKGAIAVLAILTLTLGAGAHGWKWKKNKKPKKPRVFNRVATWPVYENTDIELETAAEIIAATDDQ